MVAQTLMTPPGRLTNLDIGVKPVVATRSKSYGMNLIPTVPFGMHAPHRTTQTARLQFLVPITSAE